MNIGASMGAESKQRFGPDSVSHRCNGKGSKIFKSQLTALFGNEGDFNIEPRFRKRSRSEDIMEDTRNSIKGRIGKAVKISNTNPIKPRRFSGRRSGDDVFNNLSEVLWAECLRDEVGTNELWFRERETVSPVVKVIVKRISGIMHFSKPNSGASMTLSLNLKRVRKGEWGFFNPFSHNTSPDIRTSREPKLPIRERSSGFFVNAIKNVGSSIIALTLEGLLKFNKGFRSRVGFSDSEHRMITSRGTFILKVKIKISAPIVPSKGNRTIIRSKGGRPSTGRGLGGGSNFELGSLGVVKLKDSTYSGVTKRSGPSKPNGSSKLSNRDRDEDIINERGLNRPIFTTSSKRNGVERGFLAKRSESSIKRGRKVIVIDIRVKITHENTGPDFLSGSKRINSKKERIVVLTMLSINIVEGNPSALKKNFKSHEHAFVIPDKQLLRRGRSGGSKRSSNKKGHSRKGFISNKIFAFRDLLGKRPREENIVMIVCLETKHFSLLLSEPGFL